MFNLPFVPFPRVPLKNITDTARYLWDKVNTHDRHVVSNME